MWRHWRQRQIGTVDLSPRIRYAGTYQTFVHIIPAWEFGSGTCPTLPYSGSCFERCGKPKRHRRGMYRRRRVRYYAKWVSGMIGCVFLREGSGVSGRKDITCPAPTSSAFGICVWSSWPSCSAFANIRWRRSGRGTWPTCSQIGQHGAFGKKRGRSVRTVSGPIPCGMTARRDMR